MILFNSCTVWEVTVNATKSTSDRQVRLEMVLESDTENEWLNWWVPECRKSSNRSHISPYLSTNEKSRWTSFHPFQYSNISRKYSHFFWILLTSLKLQIDEGKKTKRRVTNTRHLRSSIQRIQSIIYSFYTGRRVCTVVLHDTHNNIW